LLVIAALALSSLCAHAQEAFPSRPIRILVGFSPGGGPDLTARQLAQRLGEVFRQPVLVENRPGAGGTVAAAMVARAMAGIELAHVPFKGIPEALGETVSGRVQLFMAPIANSVGPVKGGQVVALGVSSPRRDALLPGVPTIDEAGVAGYESVLWFGILAPAATRASVKARLSSAMAQILGDADTRALGADRHRPAADHAGGIRPHRARRCRALHAHRAHGADHRQLTAYCTFMPVSLTSFAHFWMSARMNLPN
jgi:tripartite-type tricarboxylate transporter receptor subunit TctC